MSGNTADRQASMVNRLDFFIKKTRFPPLTLGEVGMKRVFLATFTFLAVNLLNSVVLAAETEKCLTQSRNSCWTFSNKGLGGLTVSCRDDHSYLEGTVWHVPAGGSIERQFPSGWGDGLGFPEPGVKVSCEASNRTSGVTTSFNFTTFSWGDAVSVEFDKREVVVRQQDSWNPARTLVQKFPL